jgi:hypothetical protein
VYNHTLAIAIADLTAAVFGAHIESAAAIRKRSEMLKPFFLGDE